MSRSAAALFSLLLACSAGLAKGAELALEVDLDPATRRLGAAAELARPQGRFDFPLHESLSVTAVRAGNSAVPATPSAAANGSRTWTVTMPAAGRLRIEYGGTLPALERSLDHRGVLLALGPMASPEGSFLPASGNWYPTPGGLFTYTVRLSVRSGHKGLVAGKLIAETSAKERYTAAFDYAHPADGIDLMAGPYLVSERLGALPGGRQVRLRTYFFADLVPLAEGYLDDSARYLEHYSSSIGAYPFSEFSVVASPLPTGFGMPTLTYIGAAVLKLPFIRATSLGHEVLHNWWGNAVLVDYSRGNWSEGLTTFMADYAYKERESAAAAREMRLGWLRDLAAAPGGATLASFRSREHGADAVVGYGKAAMLFLMLRDAIGEAAFDKAIRQFWADQRFRSASWTELRQAFQRASGRPLEAFFAQWLERPGAPSVRIVEARQSEKGLNVTLQQSAPAYALRIPLDIAWDAGQAETHFVEMNQTKQAFTLQTGTRAKAVRLDPQFRLWRLLELEELPPILRQWFTSRSPSLSVVSIDLAFRKGAIALAGRLFEVPFRELNETSLSGETILVGLHADVDAALARLRLPPRPLQLSSKGSAQVWTVLQPGKRSQTAVISVRDASALEALMRPLPHYGGQSYLAFEGARMIERGTWPAAPRVVAVDP